MPPYLSLVMDTGVSITDWHNSYIDASISGRMATHRLPYHIVIIATWMPPYLTGIMAI
jgi:hypothetical protein